jgi:hypothetical protein
MCARKLRKRTSDTAADACSCRKYDPGVALVSCAACRSAKCNTMLTHHKVREARTLDACTPHAHSPACMLLADHARGGGAWREGCDLSLFLKSQHSNSLSSTSARGGQRRAAWQHCCSRSFRESRHAELASGWEGSARTSNKEISQGVVPCLAERPARSERAPCRTTLAHWSLLPCPRALTPCSPPPAFQGSTTATGNARCVWTPPTAWRGRCCHRARVATR